MQTMEHIAIYSLLKKIKQNNRVIAQNTILKIMPTSNNKFLKDPIENFKSRTAIYNKTSTLL